MTYLKILFIVLPLLVLHQSVFAISPNSTLELQLSQSLENPPPTPVKIPNKNPDTLPTPSIMLQYRADLTREAQAVYGLNAPIAMLAGQIWQESGGRANVTAIDLGRGLTQFMDGTIAQIVRVHPELGPANPYNPLWAIRAQTKYMMWINKRVKGKDNCEKYSAALKSYNAGLGYVQRAQKVSPQPDIWYGVTEDIASGQSHKNFIYSRWYPRQILFNHQRRFVPWGGLVCDLNNVPVDNPKFKK